MHPVNRGPPPTSLESATDPGQVVYTQCAFVTKQKQYYWYWPNCWEGNGSSLYEMSDSSLVYLRELCFADCWLRALEAEKSTAPIRLTKL